MGAEVQLPASGAAREATAYAAIPEGARRGAVVLHEIYGRQPEIDRVVERFAARGYAAVAPVLFESMASLFRPACIRAMVRAMRQGEGPFADEVRGARAWLCERAGLGPEQVGLVGFCRGGGYALALGAGWGAVSTNYGDLPPDERLAALGPTIGCYGGRDRLFRDKGAALERKLRARGIPVETHRFEGVGHSFLTDGHHPIARVLTQPSMGMVEYRPEIAEAAWAKIFAFFDAHLAA